MALQLNSYSATLRANIDKGLSIIPWVLVDLVFKGMRFNEIPSMRLKK